MWVDEAWRGKGLGRRLLTLLEDQAKDLGYSVVKLETRYSYTVRRVIKG